jgi:hypothetical protein
VWNNIFLGTILRDSSYFYFSKRRDLEMGVGSVLGIKEIQGRGVAK